ncbi:hypothetical protein GCM10022252_74990 [Streptosporangium oxazolinicum]|uniref:Uncharacterized protein n=1 Tax=Streptosporangium oxazolinicum TaxID=909287 RepID=A0ABP8BKJ1_9ACTN
MNSNDSARLISESSSRLARVLGLGPREVTDEVRAVEAALQEKEGFDHGVAFGELLLIALGNLVKERASAAPAAPGGDMMCLVREPDADAVEPHGGLDWLAYVRRERDDQLVMRSAGTTWQVALGNTREVLAELSEPWTLTLSGMVREIATGEPRSLQAGFTTLAGVEAAAAAVTWHGVRDAARQELDARLEQNLAGGGQ